MELLPLIGPAITIGVNALLLAAAYGRLQQRVTGLEQQVDGLTTHITNHLKTMDTKVVAVVQQAIEDYGRQAALDRSKERIQELEAQVAALKRK